MNLFKLLFLPLFFLLIACNKGKENEIKPINKPIDELIYATGELVWENQYDIIAETDGVLTQLYISEGGEVGSNEIIGVIDNKISKNNKLYTAQQLDIANENISTNSPQLNQLKENIKIAETKYSQDKSNADRYERLFAKESVAKIELENYLLTAKNSLSQLNVLKDQYNQIKSQAKLQQIITKNSLENSTLQENNNRLLAFQKGKVLNLFKNKGDYIRRGELIARIGNEENIKIQISIDETNINLIKLNQLVYIKLNTNKNKIYSGKISKILPNFNLLNQTYTCEVKLDNSLDFKINKTQLDANIVVNSKKNALLIPSDYLIYGDKVILKSTEDTINIKVGIKSTDYVEILDGLSEKDIILKPLR
ncbi:MAG: efflux RND transporter periplasmic adaptor subunit [Solirubrobacteraceae bacterium]